MVGLPDIRASNARIATELPPRLVAVFAGATSGIGEASLKAFAKYARSPRVYFVGRSQEAGDRIAAECKALNPDGQFEFIRADCSLLHNVDNVCRNIKSKETTINLLVLSTGIMTRGLKTSEGLHSFVSLGYYSRTRFIVNLLPLLRKATALRRVVTIAAGTKEGAVDTNDFQAWNLSVLSLRPHLTSMITLSLERLAQTAPEVSFIHDYPGPVKTNFGREAWGFSAILLKMIIAVIGPFIYIPNEESGEAHAYFATSAKYPPRANLDGASGVALSDGIAVARGSDGTVGSGVYSINWDGESASPEVEEVLAGLRRDGVANKVWEHTYVIYQLV